MFQAPRARITSLRLLFLGGPVFFMFFVMGPDAFLACDVYLDGFTDPSCTSRLGCLRPILPKPFRRIYLVSSLIFIVTEAFIEEFTSYLL